MYFVTVYTEDGGTESFATLAAAEAYIEEFGGEIASGYCDDYDAYTPDYISMEMIRETW